MEWDDFSRSISNSDMFKNKVETDIKCPKCGKNIFMRTDIVLTTYPEQYQYECDCGWSGSSFERWSGSTYNG